MNTKLAKKSASAPPKPKWGAEPEAGLSYNLLGQRLGRKGHETRERILLAALRLMEASPTSTITLTDVAREVEVRLPNLYLYFPNLAELIYACLARVMESADAAFIQKIQTRWPDKMLYTCVLDYLRAHYQFWYKHAHVLHMRNSFADAGDPRFVELRMKSSHPIWKLLVLQMDGRVEDVHTRCADFATVILTAIERIATVATSSSFDGSIGLTGAINENAYIDRLIAHEAEAVALIVGHQRASAPQTAGKGKTSISKEEKTTGKRA
jgi:AcrR family transcriptional regulator